MRRIEVLFEFKIRHNGTLWLYRGVKSMDGYYRMERRGVHSHKFKTYMSTGSLLDRDTEIAVQTCRPGAVLVESV